MKGFRFTSYLRRDTLWRPESVREEVVAGAGHAQSMVRKNQKNGLNPWREGGVAPGRRRRDKKVAGEGRSGATGACVFLQGIQFANC